MYHYGQLYVLPCHNYRVRSHEKIVEHINRLNPQFTVVFRSDENKVHYLRSAALAHECLCMCSYSKNRNQDQSYAWINFHAFVTALYESIQLSEDFNTRTLTLQQTIISNLGEYQTADSFSQIYVQNPKNFSNLGSLKIKRMAENVTSEPTVVIACEHSKKKTSQ